VSRPVTLGIVADARATLEGLAGKLQGRTIASHGRGDLPDLRAADGGVTSLWASMALPSTRPSSYHSIFDLGMLGTGIPSAIGARLGAPDREVRHAGEPCA
jgi:hypothetical protein